MGTHYQDAAIGPQSVAVGLWDAGVEAPERAVSRQAWGASFFPQILYGGKKTPQTNANNPLVFCFTAQESGTTLLLFQKCQKELVACALYLGTVQV